MVLSGWLSAWRSCRQRQVRTGTKRRHSGSAFHRHIESVEPRLLLSATADGTTSDTVVTSDSAESVTSPDGVDQWQDTTEASTVVDVQMGLDGAYDSFVSDVESISTAPDYDAALASSPVGALAESSSDEFATVSSTTEGALEDSQQSAADGQESATASATDAQSDSSTTGTDSTTSGTSDTSSGEREIFDSDSSYSALSNELLDAAMSDSSYGDGTEGGSTETTGTTDTQASGTTADSGSTSGDSGTSGDSTTSDSGDSGSTGDTSATTDGGGSGDGGTDSGGGDEEAAKEPADPRLKWEPFVLPEDVVFAETHLPAESFLDDLFLLRPTGTDSFTQENRVDAAPTITATAAELGTGERQTNSAEVVTLSQQWNSDTDWVVTQELSRTYGTNEDSVSRDTSKVGIDRSGSTTYTITAIGGTHIIVAYSATDSFGYDTALAWDESAPADDSSGTTGDTTANGGVVGDSDPDGKKADVDVGDFSASAQFSASMSFIYEEELIQSADGRLLRKTSISWMTSRSASVSASGSYEISENSGTRENVTVVRPKQNPDPNEPDQNLGAVRVTHGGNGLKLEASGSFGFNASVGMSTSINLTSTFEDGTDVDDIVITGDAMSTIGASAGGSASQTLFLDSQQSSGSEADGTDEHEYLTIDFDGSAGGSATLDFHLGFHIDSSIPTSGTSSDDGSGGDGLVSDDPTLDGTTSDSGTTSTGTTGTDTTTTSTTSADTTSSGTTGDASAVLDDSSGGGTSGDDGGTGGDATGGTVGGEDIDLGFGITMTNFGSGSSGIAYSKKERFVPEEGGEGVRTVGFGSGGSSGGSSDFGYQIVDGAPVFSLTTTFNTNVGSSYGSSVWTRRDLDAPDNVPAGMTATSDITGEIAVAEASVYAQKFAFTISFGTAGLDVAGDFEMSSRYILKDTSWYDLRETVFDSTGAITFESHSLMRNVDETVAVTTADLTDGAKSHSYTASGFWADVRTDGEDPYIQAEPEKTFEDYANIALDVVQVGLDVAGLVPVLGEAADLASAALSAARGNYAEAAISLAAMAPFTGWGATAGKYVVKAGKKVAQYADEGAAVGMAIVKRCKNGPNCFVAGTQVVVAIHDQPVVLAEAVDDESSAGLAIAFVGTGLALSAVRQVVTTPASRHGQGNVGRKKGNHLPDSPTRLF